MDFIYCLYVFIIKTHIYARTRFASFQQQRHSFKTVLHEAHRWHDIKTSGSVKIHTLLNLKFQNFQMHSVYIYVPDTMPCFLGNPEKTDTLLTHLFFKANKWENNGAL